MPQRAAPHPLKMFEEWGPLGLRQARRAGQPPTWPLGLRQARPAGQPPTWPILETREQGQPTWPILETREQAEMGWVPVHD